MAPIEGGLQGLVSRQRRAMAARQHPEAVVEMGRQRLNAEYGRPRGGQFKRERDAIPPAAHGSRLPDAACIGRETWIRCSRTCKEQPDGTATKDLVTLIVRFRIVE